MDRIIRDTRRKFVAIIILVVILVVSVSWGILETVNQQQIGTPAHVSEVYDSANENPAFAEYLAEQKQFEAHFVTLASSIKSQEKERVTKAIALTSIVVVATGVLIAIIAARKLTEPVIEAYESQERFIQDAAHELRNPLAAMTVALQQTKQKSPLITTFRRQTKRLIHINEDLLFLERRSKQEPTQLNLSELIQDVIEELQPLAKSKKVTLILKTEDNITKTMTANDYVRLVKNIVDNSIKYSHKNSQVLINQTKSKNSIHISIEDKGIGIPKIEQDKIGNRFFRANNTGDIDGTGLGLAIVQKILNSYGGLKSIQSVPNKGTTVSITLPS